MKQALRIVADPNMRATRIEQDSMGEMQVPAEALYGASTQRAILNFPVSGERIDPQIIHAFGLIKMAAARVNGELGEIPPGIAALVEKAAGEVCHGQWDDHFPVDVYQTGSGTSTNMNLNEVIANRCAQISGEGISGCWKDKSVHPNDHVNHGQSSNDTFPAAVHVAVGIALKTGLLPVLGKLRESLEEKAREFHDTIKIGRTHLMDATPVRLGQEFGAYARQIELAVERVCRGIAAIHELPIGGTAVGTGLNCHPDFPGKTIAIIAAETGIPFREATNHFEAQAARDGLVECHGQLNTCAASLFKVANDIRLLGSGPRCAIGEIQLPAVQPGSSIMPGKVNPVLCEAVTMVAARVFGNQTTVTWCGAGGHFELNAYMPVLAKCVLESIHLLTNVSDAFRRSCVDGIEVNPGRCQALIEASLSLATPLVPLIGYDKTAEIARVAFESGRTIREVCEEQPGDLGIPAEELAKALDPASMV
jgi:fumarate hydratase class II